MSELIKFSFGSFILEYPAKESTYVIITLFLLIILVAYTYKKIFELITFIVQLVDTWLRDLSTYKEHEWLAKCQAREHWLQKQASHSLNLQGKYIKTLSFSVSLSGRPIHWRAGFIIGNEQFRAENIVDTKNAITIHTGSDYEKSTKLLPVWRFYDNYTRDNPDFTTVQSDDPGNRRFELSINDNNVMLVKVQDQVIFDKQINISFRKRVYLKAWVDDKPDAIVKFKKIRWTLRTP